MIRVVGQNPILMGVAAPSAAGVDSNVDLPAIEVTDLLSEPPVVDTRIRGEKELDVRTSLVPETSKFENLQIRRRLGGRSLDRYKKYMASNTTAETRFGVEDNFLEIVQKFTESNSSNLSPSMVASWCFAYDIPCSDSLIEACIAESRIQYVSLGLKTDFKAAGLRTKHKVLLKTLIDFAKIFQETDKNDSQTLSDLLYGAEDNVERLGVTLNWDDRGFYAILGEFDRLAHLFLKTDEAMAVSELIKAMAKSHYQIKSSEME